MVLFGMAYAVASLGCAIGPFLAIVVSSLRAGSIGGACCCSSAYAAGMGLVIGVTALAVALVRVSVVARLRRAAGVVPRLGGGVLIVGRRLRRLLRLVRAAPGRGTGGGRHRPGGQRGRRGAAGDQRAGRRGRRGLAAGRAGRPDPGRGRCAHPPAYASASPMSAGHGIGESACSTNHSFIGVPRLPSKRSALPRLDQLVHPPPRQLHHQAAAGQHGHDPPVPAQRLRAEPPSARRPGHTLHCRQFGDEGIEPVLRRHASKLSTSRRRRMPLSGGLPAPAQLASTGAGPGRGGPAAVSPESWTARSRRRSSAVPGRVRHAGSRRRPRAAASRRR